MMLPKRDILAVAEGEASLSDDEIATSSQKNAPAREDTNRLNKLNIIADKKEGQNKVRVYGVRLSKFTDGRSAMQFA